MGETSGGGANGAKGPAESLPLHEQAILSISVNIKTGSGRGRKSPQSLAKIPQMGSSTVT
jgi:hypothetical protein